MVVQRISIVFLAWLLVTGGMVAHAITVWNPEENEMFYVTASIVVDGSTSNTWGYVVVKLKRSGVTVDSAIVDVDSESGDFSHTFDGPSGGCPTGAYDCKVYYQSVEKASVPFTIQDIE